MTKRTILRAATAALACLACLAPPAGTPARAASLTPAMRCEVGKLKTVSAYASCRLKVDATAVAKNLTPDFGKCTDKFNAKFPKLEEQALPDTCPSSNDIGDMRDRVETFETEVATLLSGGTLPMTACGDGTVDLGEQCDAGNLDGKTCATQGFFNGMLACSPGCTLDTSGCNATRFQDLGTTLLDHQYGLEWEKKTGANGLPNAADVHDVDNTYTYAVAASNQTRSGTLYSTFLAGLNGTVDNMTKTTGGCFAGHCDWRIPTIDELKSIAVVSPAVCGTPPCVQDAALLPNRPAFYWTDSSRAADLSGAYYVDFNTGGMGSDYKTSAYFVRAVRTRP